MHDINTLEQKDLFENKILLGVLLVGLTKPAYFGTIPFLDNLYDFFGLGCVIILVIAAVIVKPVTKSRIWILVFYGYIFLITVFLRGDLFHYIGSNFSAFAMCLLFDLWLIKKPQTLVKTFGIFEWLVYINLITVLMNPDGLYKSELYASNWFLGYKNIQIRTILPIVCMALIRSYYLYGKLSAKTIFLLLCTGSTFLLVDSATALLRLVLFLGLLLFFHSKKKELPSWVSLYSGVAIAFTGTILVVIFNIQNHFTGIIEEVFGRSASLSGRTSMWAYVLSMVKARPLWGYGYLTGTEYVQHLGELRWATHPHNFLLYILTTGGIALLVILLCGISIANKSLRSANDTIYGKIILFTLIAFLFMGISESITETVFLYPMLVLGMNAERLSLLKYGSKPVRVRLVWGKHEKSK